MGQPVTVIEKPSARAGIVRFETNRVLTGMGHERFDSIEQAEGDTPAALLARALFARGGIESIHVNGNVATVRLAPGADTAGLREAVEELYIFYRDGEAPAEVAQAGQAEAAVAGAEGGAP